MAHIVPDWGPYFKMGKPRGPIMNHPYLLYPKDPSYLNSRLLGYVTIGYREPRTHYLGNWSPRDSLGTL